MTSPELTMNPRIALGIALSLVVAVGCNRSSTDSSRRGVSATALNSADAAPATTASALAANANSVIRTVLEPHSVSALELKDDVQGKFARSHIAFALNVYRKLSANKPDDNLVFSPISLQLALGVTVVGARGGGGENRLARVMAPGVKPERINDVMQSWQEQLLRSMNTLTQPGTERVGVLRFANSLWLDDSLQPSSAFVDKSRQYYGLGVFRMPIRGASSSSLGVLNQWVSEQTDSRIVQMVKSLTSLDTAVLVSAAYFKTKFVSPFGSVEPEPFVPKPGAKATVDMMHNVLRTRVTQSLSYQAVELELLYGATSLVSIMPVSGSLQSFIHGLSAPKWSQILMDLEHNKRTVELHWPKVDFRNRYDNIQSALGLPPGPVPLPFISPSCAISQVVHEATFVANKDGIEVPSAAGTTMQSGAPSTAKEDGSLEMRFDHPFMFAIIHRLTGSILFVGQVTAP